ncbi:uncharacterized protein LOC126905527 isoform X4 [Daktulosphaira vitifoliae]|uniref:uncharacterized protein LOC126905527 isoform X4 n=1 Tax=Daktulosphaira vitifoliae TaxID=58002 RepID=UPI0021AA9D77|nr:uncharacterized protein LOC126905527 isoform X4 [Daktulosphaira vitifoliae]
MNIIFVVVLWTYVKKSQPYILAIEKVYTCDDSIARSFVSIHYTYSPKLTNGNGYLEILKDVNSNDNYQISGDVYKKSEEKWIKYEPLTQKKTNLCVYLFTDLLFFPSVRKVVNLQERCPLMQGKYPFRMGKIYTKHHPTLPYGCWKVVIDIEKPEINKAEKICLVFNSEHLLKSNHSMCE